MRKSLLGKRCYVGIDLVSTEMRLVEFERNKGEIILKKMTISPIQRENSQMCDAGICVSANDVMTKQITISADCREDEIEFQCWDEVELHYPDSMDEISLDFHVLGMNEDDPSLVDVMLVLCETKTVMHSKSIAEKAGFKVKSVDVDMYALHRAASLILPDAEKTIAFLNVEKNSLLGIVVKNGKLMYSNSQQACVNDFLESDHFTDHDQTVDQIVLSGGSPSLSKIKEELSIPTTIANPFERVNTERFDDSLCEMAPAFMVSAGLALPLGHA